MKKKIIVFIVRRHTGEVDWLLPLLFKFNKEYRVSTIEFYNVKSEIIKSPKAKTLMHIAYNKKKKIWCLIFFYKGIVQNVYDYESLKKKVFSIYHAQTIEKNNWNKNYLAFQKLVNYRNNTNQLYKIINNKITNELLK